MGEMRPVGERSDSGRTGSGRPVPRRPWTRERIARLAFLAGQGFTAKRIAVDPLVATSEGNVHRQAPRFGISLAEAASNVVSLRLPAAVLVALDRRAARAGQTREAYLRSLALADTRHEAR